MLIWNPIPASAWSECVTEKRNNRSRAPGRDLTSGSPEREAGGTVTRPRN
jgi:hypothetical protein